MGGPGKPAHRDLSVHGWPSTPIRARGRSQARSAMTSFCCVQKGQFEAGGLVRNPDPCNLRSVFQEKVMTTLRNPHPGEILNLDFLDEIGLSQNQLAHAIGVPPNRVHAIVKGSRDISADTDLRLTRFFRL